MNLEGRIPFDNMLCYQTTAPVFHKAFPVLPTATERLRQRWLLWSQAGSGESGRVSSAEGAHVFLFRLGYFLQKHFQVPMDKEEKRQVFATPPLGIFPSRCLGLCALSYRQPLTVFLSALSNWEDDQGRKTSLRNLFVPFSHEAANPCLLETI